MRHAPLVTLRAALAAHACASAPAPLPVETGELPQGTAAQFDSLLVDAAAGAPLPMGTGFDTFSTAAHTDSATGPVMANRDRLRRAMAAEGWQNYAQEWWHFGVAVERPLRFDVPLR